MKRVLLICLSLFLALVGWSAVSAEDGFYVIGGGGKSASVPKTGQTMSYGLTGTDGDLKKGVAWPTPRFTDNNNGTVTDNLTRLIWMKKANAFGGINWADALTTANGLKSGDPGTDLADGSKAGDWRLPNIRELQSLADYGFFSPGLPNTQGTGKWTEGNPFLGVQSFAYWSSTTYAFDLAKAAYVHFYDGYPAVGSKESAGVWAWYVRGGP